MGCGAAHARTFAALLPTLLSTVATSAAPVPLGCYRDVQTSRLFRKQLPDMPANASTAALCATACGRADAAHQYTLVGIEDATQCFCGGDASAPWAKVKLARIGDDKCQDACADAPSSKCGGSWAVSVYWVGKGPAPPTPAIPPPPPPPDAGPPGPHVAAPAPKPTFECDPTWPLCNTSLSLDERVSDFISSLTLADKLGILGQQTPGMRNGKTLWSRGYNWWTEDLHGARIACPRRNVNGSNLPFGRCPTIFPEANAIGNSFNSSLFWKVGEAISTEERVFFNYGVINGLSVFAPQINLNANPLWGRNMECPGEDPYLTSVYAREIIRAMQGGFGSGSGNSSARYYKTITTPKHFVGQIFEGGDMGNGTTMDRTRNDSRISIQDLESYYLRPFRAALVEGGSGSLMCAYSEINGQPMCANQYIMSKVVRGKPEDGGWGFTGFVSSDCDSIQTMEAPGCPDPDGGFNQQGCATWPGHNYSLSSAMTVSDGLRGQADTNCGYASYRFSGMRAFDQQLIDIPLIDQSVRRTMKAIFQLGLFDPQDAPGQWTHGTFDNVGTVAHKKLALEAAQQSIVLLQNPGEILPLPRGKRVVVLGPHFNATSQMLGNYRGDVCWNPGNGGDSGAEPCMQSLLAAIAAENAGGETAGEGVLYHVDNVNTENFTHALTAAKAADFVVLALGLSANNDDDGGAYQDWGGGGGEGEGTDRSSTWSRWTNSESNALGLPGAQEELFANISALGKPTCVVLINGGQVAVDTIAASNASVVEAFYPGQAGAAAIASVLFGSFNPVGKLDQTIYAKSFATEIKWWDTRLRPHAESLGRTHMFYSGTPLYRFGHGLSYTTFDLSWSTEQQPVVTLSLNNPNFVSDFQSKSFELKVGNTGKLYGRETVLAYWIPPTSVDIQLKQQLFNFSGHWLQPGASTSVSVTLPSPVEVASVSKTGDRLIYPGVYTVQVSRGHGAVLNATVVLTGSGPKLLRTFPRQWGVGSQMALDWCVEQGLDVAPHAERDLAKQWRYSIESGKLLHAPSGLCLEADGNSTSQASLATCAGSNQMQKWVFSDKGLAAGPHKSIFLGGPPSAIAGNFSTIWPRLRVPLQLASTAAGWQWHYSAAEGIVKLLNSPPLDKQVEVGDSRTGTSSRDMRLCLTAQSNTIRDAP